MIDAWNREIDYLRISITDRCNLRCKYCMPDGVEWMPMEEILSYEEILTVTEQAALLGIKKVKITGGEPLVRKGCCELIQKIKQIPQIEQVTITTNGVLLHEHIQKLAGAGVDGINVSLDTVDRETYQQITGFDKCEEVLDAIKEAANYKIPVKMNAVSIGNERNRDWEKLVLLAKELPVDVRFIEMMPIGFGKDYQGISHDALLDFIRQKYPDMEEDKQIHGNGPAVYYHIPGFLGSIGFISAIHGKFCDDCNRVRLTAQGYLKACLCYDTGADLKGILREKKSKSEKEQMLLEVMKEVIYQKPIAHCFEETDKITEQKKMVEIGG